MKSDQPAGDSPHFFFSCNQEKQLTHLSPEVELVLGFPTSALLGVSWKRFLDASHEVVANEFSSDRATHIRCFRFQTTHANDATRFLEVTIFEEATSTNETHGVAVDITHLLVQQKKWRNICQNVRTRQRQLRNELELLGKDLQHGKRMLNQSLEDQDGGLARWFPNGAIIYANDAYCRNLRMTQLATQATNFWELVAEQDRHQVQVAIIALTAKTPHACIEHRITLPSGRTLWQRHSVRALFDRHSRLIGYCSVLRDITSAKQLHEQLRTQREWSTKMSRQFAHDLRQTLTASENFACAARTLLDRPDRDLNEVRRIVQRIRETNRQATDILAGFGDMTHDKDLSMAREQPEAILHNALAMLNSIAINQHIQIDAPSHRLDVEVMADRTQLTRLFINLLTNAFESVAANPDTERIVAIRTRLQGSDVITIIEDNGPGLGDRDPLALFEEPISTKTEPGRGLGLAICKDIVLRHRGNIWCESRDPHGAAFYVQLPLADNL